MKRGERLVIVTVAQKAPSCPELGSYVLKGLKLNTPAYNVSLIGNKPTVYCTGGGYSQCAECPLFNKGVNVNIIHTQK